MSMEAKDTVIDTSKTCGAIGHCHKCQREIAQAQAEITWKAREPEIKAGNQKAYEIGVEDGKVEGIAIGIKKVVEWIIQYKTYETYTCGSDEEKRDIVTFPWRLWQAKLKEWGIE